MAANHNNLVQINIFRSALPPTPAGFGTVAILAYGTGLVNLAYRIYEDAATAAAELAAGDGLSAVEAAFAQLEPKPERVVIIETVKSVTGPPAVPDADDYVDALNHLITEGVDFYGVVVADAPITDDTIVTGLATAVENASVPLIFFCETNDSDWLTVDAFDSTPYTAIAAFERTAILYHDPSAPDYAGAAWAAYRLAFDSDAQTALFSGELTGIEADTQLTPTQKANALGNNANLALPYFTAPARVALGTNLQGRQLHQILAADWIKNRVEGRMAQLTLNYDRRGEIIPLDLTGQQIVIAEAINPVLNQGVSNGKIVGSPKVSAATITDADRAAFRLPINVDLVLTTGAMRFRINLYTVAQ